MTALQLPQCLEDSQPSSCDTISSQAQSIDSSSIFPLVSDPTIGQVLIDFRLPSVRSLRYFSFLAQVAMGWTGDGPAGQSESRNGISQDSCMEHSAQELYHVIFHVFALISVTRSFHRGSLNGSSYSRRAALFSESGKLVEHVSFVVPFWQYQHRSVAGDIVAINGMSCCNDILNQDQKLFI